MDKEKHKALSEQESFSIIYRHGKIMHDKAMKKFGLTGHQMGYLKHICQRPGISQEELAQLHRIDKGAVAKAIKGLVGKGYVRREKNPDDKRAYRLFPTAKAIKLSEKAQCHGEDIEKKMTAGMTEEEIRTLKILLAKLTDNIAKMLEEGENL
ncbi:MAG: MarR family winged helix-turn-helix transcriptional regulator [Bacillota bacterium]|nr:MarR family winged helix-turn-helix transcriptional regulator [Bacillota bacterium]